MTVGVFMPNVRGTPNAQMIIDALPRLSLDFVGGRDKPLPVAVRVHNKHRSPL